MRVDGSDVRKFCVAAREQRVPDRQEILADHRDLALCERIVAVRDTARGRILDREHGIVARAFIDRAHRRIKGLHMRKARFRILRKKLHGREIAVGTLKPLIDNALCVRQALTALVAEGILTHARRRSSSTSIS